MLPTAVSTFLLNLMISVKLCSVKSHDFSCPYIVKLFPLLCTAVRPREANWNFLTKTKRSWIVLDFPAADTEMWRTSLPSLSWELKENEKFCCGDLVYLANWDLGWIRESCPYESSGSCCWSPLFTDLWTHRCGMRWTLQWRAYNSHARFVWRELSAHQLKSKLDQQIPSLRRTTLSPFAKPHQSTHTI